MKHISYGILCTVIFQVIYPSHDNTVGTMGQDVQRELLYVVSRSNGGMPRQAFSTNGSEFDDSVDVSERTDGLSRGDDGSLRRSSIPLRHSPTDRSALARHDTYYALDREISSLNKKILQFRHYKSGNLGEIREKFTPELKVLCERVRSFQSEQGPAAQTETGLMGPLDSCLVQALLAVAVKHDLDKDIIPTPLSCSLSLHARAASPAGAAAAAACREQAHVDHIEGSLRPRVSIPHLNLEALSDSQPREVQVRESVLPQGSNKFPDIPVENCDSDFEDCQSDDSL